METGQNEIIELGLFTEKDFEYDSTDLGEHGKFIRLKYAASVANRKVASRDAIFKNTPRLVPDDSKERRRERMAHQYLLRIISKYPPGHGKGRAEWFQACADGAIAYTDCLIKGLEEIKP